MNIKKTVITVLGISGTLVTGLLLKNEMSKETVDIVKKAITPEKMFGGVPLSKLNDIAKTIDPRNYCTIDKWGFLVLHYKSNRGRQTFTTQLDLDNAKKLFNLNGGPSFPGQRYSHAGEFVKRVNETIQFTSQKK